ncbi:MAG: outer membrane PBP1 activator LpoA protein [Flavobacteriales bacterium]|jgi:outer membrane PBP1 activator LpoA protein
MQDPEELQSSILIAAQALIVHKEYDWARELSSSLDPYTLTNAQRAKQQFLLGTIALRIGEPYLAKRYLLDPQTEQLILLVNDAAAAQLREARATLLADLLEYDASISERTLLSALIADDELQSQLNNDLIWSTLMELPFHTLQNTARLEQNETLQGWYSLASNAKNSSLNLSQQLESIDNWLLIWPEHPAAKLLPADLQVTRQFADNQAKKIAILLPFTGKLQKAGEAIRDGFLSAFFNELNNSGHAPELLFYNSDAEDIDQLYDQAVVEGAEIIIGPLNKRAVTQLAKRAELSIPTLALNEIKKLSDTSEQNELDSIDDESDLESSLPTQTPKPEQGVVQTTGPEEESTMQESHQSRNLYTFSLAVESEAKQVAEKAWRDGHRRALIIAPASAWGDRGAQAFIQHWQELGGNLVAQERYANKNNYSPQISHAVGIDTSRSRNRKLRQTLGLKLTFEPRRRADIDLVFLLAKGRQAQQIKPLLAFHYAGDLPVYSTSHVFNGDTKNTNMRDLNNIRFASLPWYFESQREEKRAVTAYSNVSAGFQSLYALGVDAYHLYPRLKQFEKIKQAKYYGATGKLALAQDNTISRQQVWAIFKNGKVVPLTSDSDAVETAIAP